MPIGLVVYRVKTERVDVERNEHDHPQTRDGWRRLPDTVWADVPSRTRTTPEDPGQAGHRGTRRRKTRTLFRGRPQILSRRSVDSARARWREQTSQLAISLGDADRKNYYNSGICGVVRGTVSHPRVSEDVEVPHTHQRHTRRRRRSFRLGRTCREEATTPVEAAALPRGGNIAPERRAAPRHIFTATRYFRKGYTWSRPPIRGNGDRQS